MRWLRTIGVATALAGTVTGTGCNAGGTAWDRAESTHASTSASWHRYMESEYGEDSVPRRSGPRREAWSAERQTRPDHNWVGEFVQFLLLIGAVALQLAWLAPLL